MGEARRCAWAAGGGDRMTEYHDAEWGVPSHGDDHLFEMLTLEGAQSGLSWRTILDKREGYRRAFAGFDPAKVARFDAREDRAPARRPRHRAQPAEGGIHGRPTHAPSSTTQREFGSLDAYLWSFVGGAPIVHRHRVPGDLPRRRRSPDAMSSELEAPRVPVRRPHRVLLADAGHGDGQRSRDRVLPVPGAPRLTRPEPGSVRPGLRRLRDLRSTRCRRTSRRCSRSPRERGTGRSRRRPSPAVEPRTSRWERSSWPGSGRTPRRCAASARARCRRRRSESTSNSTSSRPSSGESLSFQSLAPLHDPSRMTSSSPARAPVAPDGGRDRHGRQQSLPPRPV